MTVRTSVNKRQREQMLKERKAEKHTRRDERRVRRGLPTVEGADTPETLNVEGTDLPVLEPTPPK